MCSRTQTPPSQPRPSLPTAGRMARRPRERDRVAERARRRKGSGARCMPRGADSTTGRPQPSLRLHLQAHPSGFPHAIVGYVDLGQDDAKETLEQHCKARRGRLGAWPCCSRALPVELTPLSSLSSPASAACASCSTGTRTPPCAPPTATTSATQGEAGRSCRARQPLVFASRRRRQPRPPHDLALQLAREAQPAEGAQSPF